MTLLRPRWVAGHLLVLVLTVSFIALGFWQLARNDHKQSLVREAARRVRRAGARMSNPRLAGGRAGAGVGPLRRRARGAAPQPGARRQRRRRRAHSAACSPTAPPSLVDRGWVPAVGDRTTPITAATATGSGGRPRDRAHVEHVERAGRGRQRPAVSSRSPASTSARIGRELPYRLQPRWIEAQAQTPAPAAGAPALPQPPAARSGEPHAVRDRVVLVRGDRHHRLADRARRHSPGAAAASQPRIVRDEATTARTAHATPVIRRSNRPGQDAHERAAAERRDRGDRPEREQSRRARR